MKTVARERFGHSTSQSCGPKWYLSDKVHTILILSMGHNLSFTLQEDNISNLTLSVAVGTNIFLLHCFDKMFQCP